MTNLLRSGVCARVVNRLGLTVYIVVPICLIGCGKSEIPILYSTEIPDALDVANARDELDLRKLEFESESVIVRRHESGSLVIEFPDGDLTLVPSNGVKAQRYHQMMLRMASEMSRYRVDQISDTTGAIIVYRYLEDCEADNKPKIGHYLVNIDDYWINGTMFNRDGRTTFDQINGDRFFMSLAINCE